MILASQYLKRDLTSIGVFDSIIDADSNFYINILRLKNTSIPEFLNSYKKINDFFSSLATLLSNSESENDVFYRNALKKFSFSEVNEINLGVSSGIRGNGFRGELARRTLSDARLIVKKGVVEPELFHLISLFEKRVGPDLLSDMIGTIIKEDIIKYSRRIYKDMKIDSVSGLIINNGIVFNPYKNIDLLLVPEEILQVIPIARCWSDIDYVVSANESIRNEVSTEVANEWYKWSTSEKKNYLKNNVFSNSDSMTRIIKSYRKSSIDKISLNSNDQYSINKCMAYIQSSNFTDLVVNNQSVDSFSAGKAIISIFKNWVENEKGWQTIQEFEQSKREKRIQSIIKLCSDYYAKKNDIRVSPETNSGNGPEDFLISRGNDSTVVEIKLSSNPQYLHGYQVQIDEYAKSEGTDNKIFVYIDLGNSDKTKKIRDIYQNDCLNGTQHAFVIFIDATKRQSASIKR